MRTSRFFLAALCLLLTPAAISVSCGGSDTSPSTSTTSTLTGGAGTGGAGSTTGSGGTAGSGGSDAGSAGSAGSGGGGGAPVDAGPEVPIQGFGAISGACGVLDAELLDGSPWIFENHLDFGADPYDDADLSWLTTGGQKIMTDPNAGGSSKASEAFAFEMLARCELAALLKTEMEIVYTDPSGKLTDELVEIDGLKIGVSVTRAVGYPFDAPYTEEQAKVLLDKKLQGILDSTANVSSGDAWKKQILYILAYGQQHADAIQAAWAKEPAALRADTIVMVTVTDGDDAFVY